MSNEVRREGQKKVCGASLSITGLRPPKAVVPACAGTVTLTRGQPNVHAEEAGGAEEAGRQAHEIAVVAPRAQVTAESRKVEAGGRAQEQIMS